MALSDGDKDALGWVMLVPGFLNVLANLTGDEGFSDAAQKLAGLPVDKIGEVLGALRTDRAFLESGVMEIGDGVEIEVVDD